MARRGFGMLEVVLAMTILALIAGVIAAAVGFAERSARLDMARLDAMEVAHRTILNYILDPATAPPPGTVVPFGSRRYEVRIEERSLIERDRERKGPERGARVVREAKPYHRLTDNERIRAALVQFAVEIYTVDAQGRRQHAHPAARLSRVFNPIALRDGEATLLRHTTRWLQGGSAR